jgi:hypothetical protein
MVSPSLLRMLVLSAVAVVFSGCIERIPRSMPSPCVTHAGPSLLAALGANDPCERRSLPLNFSKS